MVSSQLMLNAFTWSLSMFSKNLTTLVFKYLIKIFKLHRVLIKITGVYKLIYRELTKLFSSQVMQY